MTIGVIPFVIESITRLDPGIAKELSNAMDEDTNQESKFMIHIGHCHRARDFSDLDLMKKSYAAMNFFIRSDIYSEFILTGAHQTIGMNLLLLLLLLEDCNNVVVWR